MPIITEKVVIIDIYDVSLSQILKDTHKGVWLYMETTDFRYKEGISLISLVVTVNY